MGKNGPDGAELPKEAPGQAADRMLRDGQRLYLEAFRQSPAIKLLIDPSTLRILDANAAAESFYGYTIERLKSMSVSDLNTSPTETILENIARSERGGESRFVYKHRLASGECRDVEVYAGLIELGGRRVLHSIIHDITEKSRAEEELKRLVAEKETLMKELQHRVKNNLGVGSGLLSLSAGRIKDEEALRAFEAAIARVESIAAIYAKLYDTKDLTRIELGGYARDLVDALFSTYNLDPERIRLSASFEEARLDLKRSVPFGLVLNELVSNALKYAYPAPASGEIRVELGAAGGRIRLVVADDGPGIPDSALEGESGGLGMTLVRMLAGQLGARLEFDCSRGTRVELSFDAEAAAD